MAGSDESRVPLRGRHRSVSGAQPVRMRKVDKTPGRNTKWCEKCGHKQWLCICGLGVERKGT